MNLSETLIDDINKRLNILNRINESKEQLIAEYRRIEAELGKEILNLRAANKELKNVQRNSELKNQTNRLVVEVANQKYEKLMSEAHRLRILLAEKEKQVEELKDEIRIVKQHHLRV